MQQYRLKQFTDQDLAALYQQLKENKNSETHEGDLYFARLSLLAELSLRFPQNLAANPYLQAEQAILSHSANSDYQFARLHTLSIEPFCQALEKALNQDGLPLDSLEAWAKTRQVDLVKPVLTSADLVNDPFSTHVLHIQSHGNHWILIIRQTNLKTYSVFPLKTDSFNDFRREVTLQISDLNHNGRPEIVENSSSWGPGMAYWNSRTLQIYEWQGQKFEPLIDGGFNLDAWGPAQVDEIQTGLDQTNTPILTGGTSQPISCSGAFAYQKRQVYRWNGRTFKAAEEIVVPLEDSNPPDCAFYWALLSGPQNEQAVSIFKKTLQTWPEAITNQRGPAAQDYYRLVFGFWLIQQNKIEDALRQFQTVQDHPAAPDYPLPARLAADFLKAYTSGGLVNAVQGFQAALKTEITAMKEDFVIDRAKMLYYLGFYDSDQDRLPAVIFLDQFSPALYFQKSFSLFPISNTGDLLLWAKKSHLSFNSLQSSDLDGDGIEDWLVEIAWQGDWYYEDKAVHLYAFLQKDRQIVPVEIGNFPQGASQTWQAFRPQPGAPLLHVFTGSNGFYVYQLIKDEKGWQSKTIDDFSFLLEVELGKPLNWEIKMAPAGKELVINYQDCQSVHTWDNQQQKLIPTSSSPENREAKIALAEQYIYWDKTPQLAIPILEDLLNHKCWGRPRIVMDQIYPDIHVYTYYLLGLAYELDGQQDKAVQSYWQLWQTNPENFYTRIAQKKLVLK
jgi:hypothetical protein